MQHLILPEISALLPGSPVVRGSLGTRVFGVSMVCRGVICNHTISALKVVVIGSVAPVSRQAQSENIPSSKYRKYLNYLRHSRSPPATLDRQRL